MTAATPTAGNSLNSPDSRVVNAKKFVDNISDLPPVPTVVAKINTLLRNPETSASDLGKVISTDAAICAKILRIVNSSFYGLPNKISSVDQAIVILGFKALRELIISMSVFGKFKTNASHEFFDPTRFMLHSLAVGACCKHMASKFNFPGEVETYFVCGLLHDTGIMLLFNNMKPVFEKVVSHLQQDAISFCTAEQMSYGSNHAFLGAALFDKWAFDQDLILGIRYHHDPLTLPEPRENRQALLIAALVHCADVLSRLMLLGDMTDRVLSPVNSMAFRLLEKSGLNYEQLPEVMLDIHREYTASKIFLEV